MTKQIAWFGIVVAFGAFDMARADAPLGRYTVSSSTVVDNRTNLTWQRSVDPGSFADLPSASSHCSGVGSGWRVPSIAELQSLVDITKSNPAIDATAFPSTPADYFWSSTAIVGGTSGATWSVDFHDGSTTMTGGVRVRCVR